MSRRKRGLIINYNTYIIFDFETGGTNPYKTQITQIAAIALHSQKLTVEPNGTFNSELRPILDDEEAIKQGFDPIGDEALRVTKKTREGLAKAPPTKLVWENFVTWVNRFNYRKSSYTAPIACGFNINKFDLPILNRYCTLYGPVDKDGRQNLFNDIYAIDVMQEWFAWTEHNPNIKRRNLGATMDALGMPEIAKANAHDALVDVRNTANIFIKLQKYKREIGANTQWETSFASGELYIKHPEPKKDDLGSKTK